MKRKIKERMAQILALFLMIAVTIGFIPQMAAPAYAASGDPAMSLGTGVLVQGVNTTNAQRVWYAYEEWFVIGYDGSGAASVSGAATLLSVKNLIQTAFDDSSPYSNAFADSTLKTKVDIIADEILSYGEQGAVVKRTLTSGTYNRYGTDCVAGAEVKDALLWPLSTKEANAVNQELRIVDPKHTGWTSSYWWLRSPGDDDSHTAFVNGLGIVGYDGNGVRDIYGMRPAFNLNLQSVLFTSAAEGGKSSGTAGANALKAQSNLTNNGNKWKVTVTDSVHFAFAVTKTIPTENGASVTYKDAATGTNEYVSAIITDKPITDANAKITYYGQIKNCTSDSDASGTVTINTADKLGENDYLYVFNEQCNGNKKTDYASALCEVNPYPPVGRTKATNPLKINGKTATVKYSKLKKKNQTLAVTKVIKFTNKGQGTKKYTLTSAKKGKKSFKKYFKVNAKTGKLTVKKGLKKGTYKVKINVKAAGNKNYKAVTKAVTVTVKVRK